MFSKPKRTVEARAAAATAFANGLIGFKAKWDKWQSIVNNPDPPMSLIVCRKASYIKSSVALSEKALKSESPIGQGLLYSPPETREARDPRSFLVVLPYIDYLELVARSRRIVFDD